MHSIVKFSLSLSLSHSVTLYFKCNSHLSMYSFSSSPHRRFVVQTKISCKYILLFSLYLNSFSYSTPCRKDQLTVYHLSSSGLTVITVNPSVSVSVATTTQRPVAEPSHIYNPGSFYSTPQNPMLQQKELEYKGPHKLWVREAVAKVHVVTRRERRGKNVLLLWPQQNSPSPMMIPMSRTPSLP